MAPMTQTPKRPRDPNQLAKFVADLATGEVAEPSEIRSSSDAAKLGRIGGLKGGHARADKLPPERRKEIAALAAAARWKGRNGHD